MSQIIPIYIPTLISDINYNPAKVYPRIFFYNGLVECEPYWFQYKPTSGSASVTNLQVNAFPYFDHYNVVTGKLPTANSKTLLFQNELPVYGATPTGSLYSDYWETYINLLYDPKTRLFNCSGIIPLADYFSMELNDIVEWRGNYYHLRAINDYNLTTGDCNLQLLGPIISNTLSAQGFDCSFGFSVSGTETTTTTTTTSAPTTTTTSTTTTAAPTTTTTTAAALSVEYLMVAGGGGGSSRHAGGGGAGGYLSGSATITGDFSLSVVVGAGGNGTTGLGLGTNGNDTTFNGLTAVGGGRGGGEGTNNGASGGSGGGALGVNTATGGAGTSGQGNAGGIGVSYAAGGGGGAFAVGGDGENSGFWTGGAGGGGKAWFSYGQLNNAYAGGGGGGVQQNASYEYSGGAASFGGGGAGGSNSNGDNGATNRGGGGGGAGGFSTTAYNGGYGGSGIVVIRYAGSPIATGGNITESGGYTYHEFLSSGTFAKIVGTTTTTTIAPTTTTTTAGYATFYLNGGGTGFGNSSSACAGGNASSAVYTSPAYPTIDSLDPFNTRFYTNTSLTTAYDGNGDYWGISEINGGTPTNSVIILGSGYLNSVYTCGA